MTGIIKASGGIPAERFGVSTEDLANPSSINLFKHLCILPAAASMPSSAPSSSSSLLWLAAVPMGVELRPDAGQSRSRSFFLFPLPPPGPA